MSGLAEIIDENCRLRESIAALTVSVDERDDALRERDAKIAEQAVELAERDAMLEALKARAEELARHLELIQLKARGPASQRFIPEEQAAFPFPGDIVAPPRAPKPDSDDEEETAKKNKKKRKGKAPKRRNRDAFKDMPSRNLTCPATPGERCVTCKGLLNIVGKARSFRIEWVPGHFIVEDIVADKCACTDPECSDKGVLTVPSPHVLPRSLCGNGLLARVLVDKFADHLPLNRQARRMTREGFKVGSNTLSGWVNRSAVGLLGVLAEAIRDELWKGDFIQADDTGHPVQDAGDGTLRKGRLWAMTDQQHVYYAFTPTKEGEHPVALFEGYQGKLLLVDGGSEFNQVCAEMELDRAGCWSHLRTYFYDARHHHPVEATLALGTLWDLFHLERTLVGKPPDEIRDARQERAKPLVDGFFAWVKAISTGVRPKSKLGEAVTYARNQESRLRLYLDHGNLPLHNNLTELMLRQPVVGRKNWLFSRSEGGAEAAAIHFTIVGSCKLQGIDPHEYLVDMFERLPDYPSNRVHELLPRAWRLTKEAHTAKIG